MLDYTVIIFLVEIGKLIQCLEDLLGVRRWEQHSKQILNVVSALLVPTVK